MEGGYGEQVEDQGERSRAQRDREPGHAAPLRPAQRAASPRAEVRLWSGPVWCLLGAAGREGDPELRYSGGRGQRQGDHDTGRAARTVGEGARHGGGFAGAASASAGVDRRAGAALWLLPERDDDPGRRSALDDEEPDRGSDPDGDERPSLPLWHLSADPDGDQAGRRRDGEGRQVTMTGFLHEKEFSRKNFLKGSGAVVVGASVVGAGLAGKASAASPAGYLPDITKLDSWISIGADNTVTLKMSQIETGNGITTGFLQVLAEELGTDITQMRYGSSLYDSAGHALHSSVDTWIVASTGGEGGSNAMSGQGPKIRAAGAQARGILLGMASTQLGVPVGQLSVSKGVVSGGGKTITYGQLMGGKLFNATINPATLQPGVAPAKSIDSYETVTKRDKVARIDIPAKVNGVYTYVHNIRVPGMLHGRVIRPHGQGAYPYNSNVAVSVDEKSIAHIAGAKIVRVGNFLGVVAPKEYDAIQAAAQLKVVYNDNPILPGNGNLWRHYRDLDAKGKIPARVSLQVDDVDAALKSA